MEHKLKKPMLDKTFFLAATPKISRQMAALSRNNSGNTISKSINVLTPFSIYIG
jgi:hypothetical protein